MNSGILALLIGTGLTTNTENIFMQVVSAAILTTLPFAHSLLIMFAFVAFAIFPLLSSTHAEYTRKRDFVIDLYCRDIIVICVRYIIYSNLSQYMLLLPCLGIFESYSIQNMVDSYDMNTKKRIVPTQIVNHTSLAIVELLALVIGRMLLPLDALDDTKYDGFYPSLIVVIPLFTILFDLFADIGFYNIHRNFHETPFLRTFHIPDHHKNTGKHNKLMAYETYTISTIETLSIALTYFIGFGALILVYGELSTLIVSIMVSWMHTVELMGHTELSWTPKFTYNRIVHDILGISLTSKDHLIHHIYPTTNYSKRTRLMDYICNTYRGKL